MRRDRSVRLPLSGKASDLRLLWGQLIQGVHGPLAGALTGRLQLEPRALGERLHPGVSEELVGDPQLRASIESPPLTPQPLAVEEVCTRELDADACATEPAYRLLVELIGLVAGAEQRAQASFDPQRPV